jgi:hypothetical protein
MHANTRLFRCCYLRSIRIVAVAGIGASWETWDITPKNALTRAAPLLNPPTRSGASTQHRANRYVETQKTQHIETIFDDIRGVRVWFYEYPEIQENQDFGFYADKLLEDLTKLVRSQGQKKRLLHLAGHSTGGLVIKHAMIKALSGENPVHAEIAESCFSLAFFGVPHYGSTILHQDAFKASIESTTEMKLNNMIRLALNPANSSMFYQQALNFAPLSSSMRQIWAFVEGLESDLRVLSANTAGEEETHVHYFVVDERSATLSTPSVRIDNEKVIIVKSTHTNLARFGGNKDNETYREYVGDLQALVDELSSIPDSSLSWRDTISDEVVAEVHLFYEIQDTESNNIIKIFSVDAKLSDLVRSGPTACLRRRLTKTNFANIIPEVLPLHVSPLENREQEAVDITLQNVLSAVPRTSAELEVPSINVNDMPIEEPVEQPTRRGSITRERSPNFNSITTEERSHLTEPTFTDREEYVELPKRIDLYELPTLSSQKFRWIRIPCNNMAFIPRVFQCIAEETNQPILMTNLMHEQVFHAKQAVARHGNPHGRFMQPFFHTIDLGKVNPFKKLENKQFVMYFPYLHWDTFDSLIKRNEIVKRRHQQPRPYPLDDTIMKGHSKEHRLIWRYLTHSANLPLHHRRSLDQYGYPTLRDVSARDLDQVLYKRTRADADAEFKQKKSGIHSKLIEAKKRARNKAWGIRENPVDDGTRGMNAKVLMVDCLWLWIIDERTVITCFPSKETTNTADNHADLRDAIYKDINGDPRLATQCHTCVEFAALAIRHAVTVFLEQKSDKDLEVFRIFEEYISILTENLTKAFKDFRNKHQKSFLSLDELEEIHDNSNDLWCFLELRDVEDELNTIKKLLVEQRRVIEEFQEVGIKEFQMVGVENILSRNAQNWLQDSLRYLSDYQGLVDHMLHNCTSAQEHFKTLLDMKQKKANVVEAALARKSADRAAQQSRAVMTFTVFTVFFLPLSFFTSLFGMNVREWSGVQSNVQVHTVLVLMCAVSAAVISLALLLAFNKPVRDRAYWLYDALKEWWNKEGNSQEPHRNAPKGKFQGRLFRLFRRQRPDIKDDEEKGEPRNGFEILESGLNFSQKSSLSSNRLKTE